MVNSHGASRFRVIGTRCTPDPSSGARVPGLVGSEQTWLQAIDRRMGRPSCGHCVIMALPGPRGPGCPHTVGTQTAGATSNLTLPWLLSGASWPTYPFLLGQPPTPLSPPGHPQAKPSFPGQNGVRPAGLMNGFNNQAIPPPAHLPCCPRPTAGAGVSPHPSGRSRRNGDHPPSLFRALQEPEQLS